MVTQHCNLITNGDHPRLPKTLATIGDRVAEAKGLEYTTVLVDNYGSRAAWIGGQTPQVQWPSGKRQGESLDIVKALEPWIHCRNGSVNHRNKGVYGQKTAGGKTNGRSTRKYVRRRRLLNV